MNENEEEDISREELIERSITAGTYHARRVGETIATKEKYEQRKTIERLEQALESLLKAVQLLKEEL